jgi:hypothetical protein
MFKNLTLNSLKLRKKNIFNLDFFQFTKIKKNIFKKFEVDLILNKLNNYL